MSCSTVLRPKDPRFWIGIAAASVVAAVAVRAHRRRDQPLHRRRPAAKALDVSGLESPEVQILTPPVAGRKDSLMSASTETTTSPSQPSLPRDTSVDSSSTDALRQFSLKDDDPSPLFGCPWHNGLAQLLSHGELGRLRSTCRHVKEELTVCHDGSPYLLVPSLELKNNMLEVQAALQNVSMPHVCILRVWSRPSLLNIAQSIADGRAAGLLRLEKLAVRGCPMQGHEVSGLLKPIVASSRSFDLLNLERNSLRDDTVQTLCQEGVIDMIQSLSLRFNMIGQRGAEALASCPAARRLRFINLKMNCLGDGGAAALARMLHEPDCALNLLNLRKQGPPLTDKSAVLLADALRFNSSLKKLRLRKNRIGDDGAAALAVAVTERLKRLCRDEPASEEVYFELDLEDNKITSKGAAALRQACESIPARARLEVLLFGNPVESTDSYIDGMRRLSFVSKPDGAR